MIYYSLKTKIKSFLPVVWFRVLLAKIQETNSNTKHFCISGIYKNPIKLQTHLAIATHALEKGMSIGKVRYGFGIPKAIELINGLQYYLQIGGNKDFVNESCTVIKRYLEFNECNGVDMSGVRSRFDKLCGDNVVFFVPYGGIQELDHSTIIDNERSSFYIFSQSRFAIRDFGDAPIKKDDIEKALKLCERTPTACNRQSQRIHVYLNKDLKNKIFGLQGGGKGFVDDMQGAILICCDLRCYDFYETNLPYVDGGLYAMNLLYALHFYDIATIPLTMGHKAKYTKKIMKEMQLPSNEVPVLLIGIGSFKESCRVAQSHRKEWKEYTKIID